MCSNSVQYEVASVQTLISLQKYFRHKVAPHNSNEIILLTVSELDPSACIVQCLLAHIFTRASKSTAFQLINSITIK